MTKGLLYVCFGEKFDESLAALTDISRRFTKIPITILTNQKKICSAWNKQNDIDFVFFDMKQSENRQIKTQAIFHSPYEKTLLLDAYTVIQKTGIENLFSLLDNADILANPKFKILSGKPTFKLYVNTIEKTYTKTPLTVFSGGFLGFRNNEKVKDFFNLWNQYWRFMGSGREMPSLACALKNSSVIVQQKVGFYAYDHEDENCIIQHNWQWGNKSIFPQLNLFKKFAVVNPKADKSFDKRKKDDWTLVQCP